MQPDSDNLNRFSDDLPAFVRGQLSPEREQEIHSAARTDPELVRAIREEQALESFLDSLKVPEISSDFRQHFWKRFYAENSRTPWIRLAGPIAAVLVLALGVYIFAYGGESTPAEQPIAENGNSATEDTVVEDKGSPTPTAAAVQEIDFSFVEDRPDDKNRKLTLDELELLKALDNAEFVHLDKVTNSEDMELLNDLSLLLDLDAEDGQ
ncbi:MAG: anti-sigma factor family protein [Planctomycetota bacterium]